MTEGELEVGFHEAMLDVYRRARAELNYNAMRFLQMVTDRGGRVAAKELLRPGGYSEGFTRLWEERRLDISMEALVLRQPWRRLFTADELEVARRRLQEHGFPVEELGA